MDYHGVLHGREVWVEVLRNGEQGFEEGLAGGKATCLMCLCRGEARSNGVVSSEEAKFVAEDGDIGEVVRKRYMC